MRYCLYTLALAALIVSCAGAYLQLAGFPTAVSVSGATLRHDHSPIPPADAPTDRNDLSLIGEAFHAPAPGSIENMAGFAQSPDELLGLDAAKLDRILIEPQPDTQISLTHQRSRRAPRSAWSDFIDHAAFPLEFGGPVPPTLRIDATTQSSPRVDPLSPHHDRLNLLGLSGVAIGSTRPISTTSRDGLVDVLPYKDISFGQHLGN